MCARFRSLKDFSQLPKDMADWTRLNFEYNPNVAPTEMVPAFLSEGPSPLKARHARFGINLSPMGGKKRPPLLNARTDSLRRGSFKKLLHQRRCIIPAEGFYEWRKEDGKKQPQPYFFYRKDNKPILFAGIWDYSDVKGDEMPSFAILTDEPNELVKPYHDRMPVIVDAGTTWLTENTNPLENLKPLGPEMFAVRPVNPSVNKVSQKDIDAIESVETDSNDDHI